MLEDVVSEPDGRGPWFTSLYYGECGMCRKIIDPGDRTRFHGEGTYLCEECGQA